jgi:hypothetical protein
LRDGDARRAFMEGSFFTASVLTRLTGVNLT